MAATVAARPRRQLVPELDVREPSWFARLPPWLFPALLLVVLVGISAFIRTRFLSGQFWMDEALSVGISSHSLSAIPGVLRHDGSPPLYYLLLHVWMSISGSSESATHALSLLFGLLTIPVGMWGAWTLFGRRAGLLAAVIFAFNGFLTQYAQETRMYELMALLGLLATVGFVQAFVFRRRRYLALFAVAQALMLYTHAWGVFFGAGAVLALIPIYRASDERRALLRDAVLAFAGAGVLFLPWLPNFIYQVTHTGAPWDVTPRFGVPVQLSRNLMGGDRVTIALLIPTVIGLVEVGTRGWRRTRDATLLWALIVLPVATLALAWLSSQITPAWVARYFAPVLPAILLLASWGCARARIVGVVAVAVSIVFLVNPTVVIPTPKSDVRTISGELTPRLHEGDLVVFSQPEQVPLAWYYLPGGLRYASALGPVSDPRYMNWVDALSRLRASDPRAMFERLMASVAPGQQVLFLRPLTEGQQNWRSPWTSLVRRGAAQWGALFAADPDLRAVAWGPHTYRGACCVPSSAILYRRVR